MVKNGRFRHKLEIAECNKRNVPKYRILRADKRGLDTDWFHVTTGLKQGCLLSLLLFNLFINNLVESIKNLNIGIDVGEEKVSLLLYADDIILLAENENDMQIVLDMLSVWCRNNKLQVNETKSNIIHFRKTSVPRSNVAAKH